MNVAGWALRIEDSNLPVTHSLGGLILITDAHLDGDVASHRAEQPSIGERRDIASLDAKVLQLTARLAPGRPRVIPWTREMPHGRRAAVPGCRS